MSFGRNAKYDESNENGCGCSHPPSQSREFWHFSLVYACVCVYVCVCQLILTVCSYLYGRRMVIIISFILAAFVLIWFHYTVISHQYYTHSMWQSVDVGKFRPVHMIGPEPYFAILAELAEFQFIRSIYFPLISVAVLNTLAWVHGLRAYKRILWVLRPFFPVHCNGKLLW